MERFDAIDKKILAELDTDPRIPTTALARKIRVSQQVAHYHLHNLFKNKIITNIGTVINYHNLGLQQYRILTTLSEKGEEQRKQIFQFLGGHHQVYWAAAIGGDWDLIIVIITHDYFDLTTFLTMVQEEFPGCIKGYTILRVFYQEFYRHKFLTTPHHFFSVDSRSKRSFELLKSVDTLDYKILHVLKNNARTHFLEIGSKLGVSYKTVQYRVKKLEKLHIIAGYRLFFKSSEFGYSAYQLILRLDNYTQRSIDELLAYARYDPLITQTLLTLGTGDVYLHLRSKSLQEVQTMIIKLRNKFGIIKDYKITPIFEDILIDHLPMSGVLAAEEAVR